MYVLMCCGCEIGGGVPGLVLVCFDVVGCVWCGCDVVGCGVVGGTLFLLLGGVNIGSVNGFFTLTNCLCV